MPTINPAATAAEREPEVTAQTAPEGTSALPRLRNGTHKVVPLAPLPVPELRGRNGLVPAPLPWDGRRTVAMFCYESPESLIGQYVWRLATALGARQTAVHLFARDPFPFEAANVAVHAVGAGAGGGLVEQVNEFNSRACNAFAKHVPVGAGPVTLLGYEWSSVPALSLLHATRDLDPILALNSLERQRSDMQSELSRQIDAIECLGLRQARKVWLHEASVAAVARAAVPECAERLAPVQLPFPAHAFQHQLDPGRVKERYQIGPLDPLVLCIGDLDERHGADVLMKSVPAVLKNHKQARFVFVGDGTLYWPLRVHARYLLLEHAVRLLGHLEGRPLFDLVQAADLVVVPSRAPTECWPIQAAWAASRPVVASHELTAGLDLHHEQNAVLVYPHESSCVWGIERILHDWDFARALGGAGPQNLEDRFGWQSVAIQLEELMAQPQPA